MMSSSAASNVPSSSGEKRREASVKNMRPSFATTTASAYRMGSAPT